LFLPPNTTSKLQPLDSGIIHSLKVNYRNFLLRAQICDYETFLANRENENDVFTLKNIPFGCIKMYKAMLAQTACTCNKQLYQKIATIKY